MPNRYEDIEAIIGQSFTIGYGPLSALLQVERNTAEGHEDEILLSINTTINGGSHRFISTYNATNAEDLCNLKTVVDRLVATETAIYNYIDGKIAEMTGGTTGNNVMLLPLAINVNDITTETYENLFGSLPRDKFVEKVIFEVTTPFSKINETDTLEFSVGTDEDKEAFVPRFGLEHLQSTYVVNVCKSLSQETNIKLFAYLNESVDPEPEPEPEPSPYDPNFTQRVENNHAGVAASLTTDASGNVVHISLSGDALIGNVEDTDTFGEITGNYMDFGVNIPLHEDGSCHYRIVQMNPALALYDGIDEYVHNVDGVWTKDREYTIAAGETDELLLKFLMGQQANSDDFTHLYIYDLDNDTPESAFRSYHIENLLNFAAPINVPMTVSEEETPLFDVEFISVKEGAISSTLDENGNTIYHLQGQVTDKSAEMRAALGIDAVAPCTMISIRCNKDFGAAGARVTISNPYLKQVEDSKTDDGEFYYTDMMVYPSIITDGTFWIDIPLCNDASYPIVVLITDQATGQSYTVSVDNQLTIIPATQPSEERLVYRDSFNLTARDEPSVTAAGDTGAMRVRILSF